MPYTKYLTHASKLLADIKEVPTDAIIPYLVQSTELSQRVHDTFNYDDLENADIRGEAITNITVQSFTHELEILKASVPKTMQNDSKPTSNTHLRAEYIANMIH